jgi:hypothetical protein
VTPPVAPSDYQCCCLLSLLLLQLLLLLLLLLPLLLLRFLKTKPVPFEEKLHAIAYVNRNCADRAGRASIMRALINLKEKAKVGFSVHVFMHARAGM